MQMSHPNKYIKQLQEQKTQLQQLLHCQICYSKAEQPILCPHCSKLYCNHCINLLLQFKNDCPNCRKIIKGQLTNCSRFVNEISGIINTIVQIQKDEKLCSQHGISLNYFCVECNRSACCQCKMFGEHQDHEFKAIGIIYQMKYQHIRQLLSSLKSKIVESQSILKESKGSLSQIQLSAEINISEIQQYGQKYKNILLKQMGKINQSQPDKSILKTQLSELQEIKQEIMREAQHAKKNYCYKYDMGLINRLDDLLIKHQEISSIDRNVAVCTQAIPAWSKFTITVRNYSDRKAENQELYSQKVSYQGSEWRVIICKKGINNNHYLSIFIQLLKNPDKLTNYQYSLDIINRKDKKKTITKCYRSNFVINEWLGYDKIIKENELQSEQFVIKEENILQIQFGVRLLSYFDLFKRRQSLLRDIDRTIELEEMKIEQFQKRISKNDIHSFTSL